MYYGYCYYITPAKIARLKLPGDFPMGLGIPPLRIKTTLESNPLKSIMLARRLDLAGTLTGFLALRASISWLCEHVRIPLFGSPFVGGR